MRSTLHGALYAGVDFALVTYDSDWPNGMKKTLNKGGMVFNDISEIHEWVMQS